MTSNLKSHFLAAVATMLACSVLPSSARAQSAPGNLDSYIEQALRDWQVPGLTLAVVKDDRAVLTRGYGLKKLGSPQKVDERTLFGIGSTSKAFGAATVAALVSDGELGWNDPVKLYLPWLEVYDPWVSEHLLVRDLLTQRLGTSYKDENKLRAFSTDAKDQLQRSRWLKPLAPFRSQYVYSNNMFIAAGLTVATVSNQSWPQFARERLWEPLGMTSTNADSQAARSSSNAATPHVGPEGTAPTAIVWEFPDHIAVPSGGVNSNARDMAQWLRFQLAQGAIGERRLIKRDVFQQMHLPQTAITDPGGAADIATQYPAKVREAGQMRSWSYGMGWYVTEYRGRKFVYHSGTIEGFRTGIGLLPEENLAVYVNVNRTPTLLPMAIILQAFDAYLGLPATDWGSLFRDPEQR